MENYLICDIGNTNFSFFDGEKYFKIPINEKLPSINRVYYISVNDKATKKLLKYSKEAINLEKYIKIDTNYKNLGIDRKVVCMFLEEGVVVDAGSAITIDFVKNYKHLGGYILPGLSAFRKSYLDISNKLNFEFEITNTYPNNTNSAISQAILNSIVSLIKGKNIILTGGDGLFLSKYIKNSVYIDNLVLKNLEKIVNSI